MIVAGEASGDTHGAKLVLALRDIDPDTTFEFFGAAGPKMRDAGVHAVVESDAMAIVGVAEIARALPMFLKAFRDLKEAARCERPDAVVLVDFPDFNLKLAKALKKQGLTIIYYISPQLWAWRKYRIAAIRKNVDLLLTILPFEKQWYRERGVEHVEYVGSPLANEIHAVRSKETFCDDHNLDSTRPQIALLPGSRHKEIVRILPVMIGAAAKIAKLHPEVQFIVAVGGAKNLRDVDGAIADANKKGTLMPETLVIVESETYDALKAADAAAVTSGTATLETGIIGTPLAIVYKTSGINYTLLRPLIKVEHYGLINLIAGKRVAKELIQHEFTAGTLATELMRLMEPKTNTEMREQLRLASDRLGDGGASKRAAEAVLRLINRIL